MNNVLILLTLPEKVRAEYSDPLREQFPELSFTVVGHNSEMDPHLETTDILITFGPMLANRAGEIFGRAKNLKWIQALGTGVDNITDIPSLRPDVLVTNIRGIHGEPVSESALMSMLAFARDLPRSVRAQQNRKWDRFPATLLDGKTVGIFGVGVIAEALAPRCKAMGMTVVGVSTAKRDVAGFDRMVERKNLASAVQEFDFFVVLTPLSAETEGIVGKEVLASMKPGSFLINLARGGVIDETALIETLEQKKIGGAALDVFTTEPLPEDHPFWGMENVIITPHLGGFCDVYVARALPVIAENMRRFLAGEAAKMANLVTR